MTHKTFLPLALCVALAGCKGPGPALQPQPQPTSAVGPAVAAASYDAKTPPTRKEILRVLFRSQDIALSSDPSCSGVGTDAKDTNLGDYLAGFLAEQDDAKGGNWIDISTKPTTGSEQQPLWRNDVVLRHSNGDDVWGWGVSFAMRAKDHSVAPGSVRCTGAG